MTTLQNIIATYAILMLLGLGIGHFWDMVALLIVMPVIIGGAVYVLVEFEWFLVFAILIIGAFIFAAVSQFVGPEWAIVNLMREANVLDKNGESRAAAEKRHTADIMRQGRWNK
jgi:hypothetical protein